MTAKEQRIDSLKQSFNTHPAVNFLGVNLISLSLVNSLGSAMVRTIAKGELMVHSDLKAGLIVQGGLSFAIANFAGVYAAMVLTEIHTPLVRVQEIEYLGPIKQNDVVTAVATAEKIDEVMIRVTFDVVVDSESKLKGTLYYRDKKK
jgi:acyl-coenzyme A thioesterase PaaI-like protein